MVEIAFQVQQVSTLILSGDKVYQACEKVGLSLHQWYRYRGGHFKLQQKLTLARLNKRKRKLVNGVNAVDKEILKWSG